MVENQTKKTCLEVVIVNFMLKREQSKQKNLLDWILYSIFAYIKLEDDNNNITQIV